MGGQRWGGAGERGSREEVTSPGGAWPRQWGGEENRAPGEEVGVQPGPRARPAGGGETFGSLGMEQVRPDPQTSLPPLHLIHPSFVEHLQYTWPLARYCAVKYHFLFFSE